MNAVRVSSLPGMLVSYHGDVKDTVESCTIHYEIGRRRNTTAARAYSPIRERASLLKTHA